MDGTDLLLSLGVVWLAAKVAAEGMERLGQTAVLGELLAGVLIGPHALGLVSESEVLSGLAGIGVILLLFEIGLQSELSELLRSGVQSTLVALVGIVCPFILGYVFGRWSSHSEIVSVFLGATLTATSVGITARVLADLGRLQDSAARIILGAAIIDDVLGLVILATVTGLVHTGNFSLGAVALILLKALAFLCLALSIGARVAPAVLRVGRRMHTRGAAVVTAVVWCVLFAVVAEMIGLAAIVGAFAAGLVLSNTERRVHMEDHLKTLTDLFAPIFFVLVGMKVDVSVLSPIGPLGGSGLLAVGLLTIIAVVGKLAAGVLVYQKGVRAWAVAVGMVPRGEVGLIFAGMGVSSGVLDAGLYAIVVAMVMLSTFIAPPWLKAIYGAPAST